MQISRQNKHDLPQMRTAPSERHPYMAELSTAARSSGEPGEGGGEADELEVLAGHVT